MIRGWLEVTPFFVRPKLGQGCCEIPRPHVFEPLPTFFDYTYYIDVEFSSRRWLFWATFALKNVNIVESNRLLISTNKNFPTFAFQNLESFRLILICHGKNF